MLRKLFFTTTLILGMSSLASSHDCSVWPGTRSCAAGKDTIIIRAAVKQAPAKAEAADPSLLRIMYV